MLQQKQQRSLPLAGRVREGGGEATSAQKPKINRRVNKHDNTPIDYERAKALRNNPSPFEQKLWVVMRDQAKLKKLKFRRQQAIHPFIADFACMEARLVVELDGDSHDTRQEYDKSRDEKLKQMGFTVLRFRNEDVVQSLDFVVETIMNQATVLRTPLPNPPRKGEGILSCNGEEL